MALELLHRLKHDGKVFEAGTKYSKLPKDAKEAAKEAGIVFDSKDLEEEAEGGEEAEPLQDETEEEEVLDAEAEEARE